MSAAGAESLLPCCRCRLLPCYSRCAPSIDPKEHQRRYQVEAMLIPKWSLVFPCSYAPLRLRNEARAGAGLHIQPRKKNKKNIARRNSRGAGGGRENKNTTWMLSFMAGPPRLPASGRETTMGDSEYTGPCSCLLNCVRSWREREALRRHTELLRQGASKACSSSILCLSQREHPRRCSANVCCNLRPVMCVIELAHLFLVAWSRALITL